MRNNRMLWSWSQSPTVGLLPPDRERFDRAGGIEGLDHGHKDCRDFEMIVLSRSCDDLVKIVPEVKQQNYKGSLCINLVVVLSNSVRDSCKGKCSAMLFFLERIFFEQNNSIRRKLQYDFRHYRHCEPSVTRKLA